MAEFNEADHPRDSDGKFGNGGMSSASAREHFDNDEVPEGWYIHGRARSEDLDTGYVIQTTKNTETARSYAGGSGSVWYIKPSADAKVLNLSDADNDDMQEVEAAFRKSFEDGEFPDQKYLPDDVDEAWEAVKPDFAPQNIVDSAAAYDNPDWVEWLTANVGVDAVETADGAVMLKDSVTFPRL